METPGGKIRRHLETGMPDAHPILRSIPGIGPVTATALAGMAPYACDSGDRTGRRSVRVRRRRPRRILYMAAMAVATYNVPLAAFHQRPVERGKLPEWRSSRSCESP